MKSLFLVDILLLTSVTLNAYYYMFMIDIL